MSKPSLQLSCEPLTRVKSAHRQSPAAPTPTTGFLAKSFPVMEPQRCLAVLRLPLAAASKPWGRTLCALHAAEGEDGIKAIAVTAAGNLFEYSVQVGENSCKGAKADSLGSQKREQSDEAAGLQVCCPPVVL